MDFAAFGRTRWMYDAIVGAVAAGHRPVLIGTAAPAREYGIGEDAFRELAMRHGAQFFADGRINDPARIEQARQCGAQVAISVNWPSLIGPAMRAVFKYGVVNAHAGDLPRYRGNACPNWAILAGEERIHVTLHRMGDGIDDGPILLQRSMPLAPQTYVTDVYRFLGDAIPEMFVELLDRIACNHIIAREQPEDQALVLRCFPRREEDSEIDWSRPVAEVDRLVRASAEPFAGAYTWLDGRRVRIWRARPETLPYRWYGVPGQVVERRSDGAVSVLCADGILLVDELEIEGSGRGSASQLIRSTRLRFGLNPSEEIAALRRRIEALESRISREEA